jgi:hypothetical protein
MGKSSCDVDSSTDGFIVKQFTQRASSGFEQPALGNYLSLLFITETFSFSYIVIMTGSVSCKQTACFEAEKPIVKSLKNYRQELISSHTCLYGIHIYSYVSCMRIHMHRD